MNYEEYCEKNELPVINTTLYCGKGGKVYVQFSQEIGWIRTDFWWFLRFVGTYLGGKLMYIFGGLK